jgi:sodium transport system ATP-binding protein
VAALCDQIVIISNGSVAAQGSSAELLHRTGQDNLEDAFIEIIGTDEGLQ